ncbi:hypothetical protein CF319_g5110 [Tilletia indica]|nr:hypothetical protein CF319_g5110 [Tilletia indica]
MSSSATPANDGARRERDRDRGATSPGGEGRPTSPASAAVGAGQLLPPKHSSFFPSADPQSRSLPYAALTPPQAPSFPQGTLPSFLERTNSDAFKHNVLPALAPPGSSLPRAVPISPRSKRLSTTAPGLLPDSSGTLPYSGWSGAPSTASSVSSISGALHGPRRDSSPPYAPGGGSKSAPGPGPSNAHIIVSSSSAISTFNSPQLHGAGSGGGSSAGAAIAQGYRNGGSSAHQGHPLDQGYPSRRHPDSHYDQPSSSSHPSRVPSFSGKAEGGPQPSRRSRGSEQNPADHHTWHANSRTNTDEPSQGNPGHEPEGSAQGQSSKDSELPNESSKIENSADASQSVNSSDRKVSCLECRASKVKCTGKTPDNKACARCQRICRPCVFENHRRGRRPDNLKFQKLEKSLETVTRAFNDFRKQQDPEPTADSASKPGKVHQPEEPVKKKQKRGNTARAADATSPDQGPADNQELPLEMGLVGSSRRTSVQMPVGPPHPHAPPLDHNSGFEPVPRHDESIGPAPGGEHDSHREVPWYGSNGNVGHPLPPGPPIMLPPLAADSRSRAITIGCHVSLPDCDLGCDPIARNVITLREACELFETFMNLQNQYFPCLDSVLHTFEFVRDRSPFLLSVACTVAARLTEHGNNVVVRLQQFLESVLFPEIWQRGLRSVEIVQGLTLLAAFHDVPKTAANDQTWQYISLAFGIAIQLGLNRRPKLPEHATMMDQRMARNGERGWLLLFLVESLSATHMGRRSMFNVDRFIGASDSWHLNVAALPADRNIVALVQLRRTQTRLHDLFESNIADPATGEPALTAYRFDIYIRTSMGELDTWKSLWYDSVSWAPHEQGVSREILFAYLAANLMQCVLALRACPGGDTAASILRQASRTAVDALNVLILFEWPDLVFAVNQNVVFASYCAILALRMTTHEKRWRGAGAIDALYIFELVDKLVISLSQTGGSLRRSATALSYASYLGGILDHYQNQYEAAKYEAAMSGGNGAAPFVPLQRRRGPEINVREYEASPVGVIMIPKHPHTGTPTLVNPPRASIFSDMTFFDTFFEEL